MTTKTFVRVSALFWLALIPFLAVATSPSEREIMAAQAAQEYLQKYGTHFLRDMERNGRFIVEVNPEASDLTHVADVFLAGPAGQVLPQLLEEMRALRT